MKRTRISLNDIAAADNLVLAAWKAARGKRQWAEVQCFFAGFDETIARLSSDILAGVVPYGEYRSFEIHDPKKRLIHAACFRDRVLQHAIMNLAEPVFERTLVPTSYACRPGLGVHKAIARVQANLRRFPWFAKVDVDGDFPSIDHACLKRLLARRFKGDDFLALLGRIIDSCPAAPGRGLPIGSLSSQHFANHYLDGADRFLLDHPLVCAHVRYMDDTIWWGHERESVRQVLVELRVWLANERRLRLKTTLQINRSERGVTWCGARVLRRSLRLTPRKQRRYHQGCRQWEAAWSATAAGRVVIAGDNRVLRGGSWNNNGRNVRSANRNRNEPGNRNSNIGFRLALAQVSVKPALDQMTLLSAASRRQKVNALRQAGRHPAERLPKRRLEGSS